MLSCTAVALFSVMSALAKGLGGTYATIQIILFRSAFALIPVAVAVHRIGLTSSLHVQRPGLIAVRAILGLLAMGTYFYSLTVLPLVEVIALTFAAPLFTSVFGIVFLGEHVGWRRWTAIFIGFAGVLVMLRPGSALFSPWSLLPLILAMFYSLSVITVRKLARTETSAAIVLYFSVICVTVAAVGTPFVWITPTWTHLGLLIAMGVAGGTIQLCAAAALRRAEVALLAPFEYTSMLWTTIIGYLIWRELPEPHIWLGATTVGISAVYIAYRESKVAR